MFEKLFVKYARAVSNEQERRKLYRLFCARTISEIIFLAVCVAVIFEALFYSDAIDAAQISDWQFIMLGVTLALWLVSGIVALVLWLTFRSAYKKILDRPDSASEMPEVASYRRKTREGNAAAKKSMRWAAVVLAAGIVVMIAMVVADFVLNPEAEDLGILSYAGIGVFAVCLFIFLLALSFSQFKKTAEGDTVEMRTAGEARAIDLVQGREHKYSLQEDKNAQTYRFLFPDDDLFRTAEDVRKKQVKISVYAAAGAFLNNKFVADLRKEVRPIEDEIERERRLAQESAPANQGTIDADEEGGNGAE